MMKVDIKPIIESVEKLEIDFNNRDQNNNESCVKIKDIAYDVLASLKRHQDKPDNEEFDDVFEDLIFRVIKMVGQL